ncbi:hypothetical protein TNCV_2524451 [Trichonephila clavipes]|nr:hypothetical protein TNCV_2524451 [Trichonephila clavipes]
MVRRRTESREGSLGYPGVVTPVFTKDGKPLEKRKRSPRERETRTPLKKIIVKIFRFPLGLLRVQPGKVEHREEVGFTRNTSSSLLTSRKLDRRSQANRVCWVGWFSHWGEESERVLCFLRFEGAERIWAYFYIYSNLNSVCEVLE